MLTSDETPSGRCLICQSHLEAGLCARCGASATEVAATIRSQAESFPEDFKQLKLRDLRALLKQDDEHSEDLWRLTSPEFRAKTVEAETDQQLSYFRRQALIMVPSTLVSVLLSLLAARSLSSVFELGLILHSVVSVLAVVILAVPALMLIEQFVPTTGRGSVVPVSLSTSANRRAKVTLLVKPEFLFPLVLIFTWLLSLILYPAA